MLVNLCPFDRNLGSLGYGGMHAYNPSIWEVETGGRSGIQGHPSTIAQKILSWPGLHEKPLPVSTIKNP